jgi:uncharacterized protein (UPF0332 family)
VSDIRDALSAMIAKSRAKIRAAERSLEDGDWDDACSRAYYAVFHAVSAVLRERDLVLSSHAQTIAAFNREFVHKGTFPKGFSRTLRQLFDDRQSGDYDVPSILDEATARKYVESAEEVVSACAAYLEDQLGESFDPPT